MSEEICLDALEEVKPDEKVPLDVYVRLPPDASGAQYLRRKRWRTFGEVFKDMHDALYIRVCSKCGHEAKDGHKEWDKPCKKCGGEMTPLIDEYDSGPANIKEFKATRQIADADEMVADIVCYSHVGGNEGYYATMGVLLKRNHVEGTRFVALYWVKSFSGMQHVHNLVERMMKATGAWPVYGK